MTVDTKKLGIWRKYDIILERVQHKFLTFLDYDYLYFWIVSTEHGSVFSL